MTSERNNGVRRSPFVPAVEVMTHIPMGVAPVGSGESVLPTDAEMQMPEVGVDQTQAESAQGRLTWPPRSKRQTSM